MAEDVEVTARRLGCQWETATVDHYKPVWGDVDVLEMMSRPCQGCKSRFSFKTIYSDILPGCILPLNYFYLFCLVVVFFFSLIGLAGLYGAGYWTAGRRDEFVLSVGRSRTTEQCFWTMLKGSPLIQEENLTKKNVYDNK